MPRLFIVAAAFTIAFAMGCNSTPTAPSIANVAGEWGGTTCPPDRPVSCAIGFTISQDGSTLAGRYGGTTYGGTLTGAVSGRIVSLELTPTYPFPRPAYALTLTIVGDRMSGPYPGSGAISLTR